MSGYSVITAQDGQQALSMIETYHPHVLVTDINMPRMDGYQLVTQVRRKPAFRLLPVVFLTERTDTAARIQGYQIGCDVYLPKPFEMKELGAVIRNLVERQMIRAELRFPTPEEARGHVQTPASTSTHKKDHTPQEAIASKSNAFDLTNREQEVLDLLTQGLSNVEIGQRLHLSPRTVEKHVSSLLRKTETSKRAELVRFAMENHLVE
jgi:DNA-binding NarL/FixJ family response regulator